MYICLGIDEKRRMTKDFRVEVKYILFLKEKIFLASPRDNVGRPRGFILSTAVIE